jgi:putative spermidine/putrescine transport system substrate-binding protein
MLKFMTTSAFSAFLLSGAAFADDLAGKSWDDIVAQAKEEGELTWYVWYFQPEFREQVKAFEAETGITVKLPPVSSGEDAMKKLLAESGRATGDIDVLALGGDNASKLDLTENFYGPILAMLPQQDALTDKLNGGDWQGYGVGYWGNQTGIAYDSNRVEAATLPQSVEDLSAWIEANPYQLGFNFENGGSGPSFIHNIARNLTGITPDSTVETTPDLQPVWDWFNAREDKFVITGSNADSLTRLNSGEFLMVPAWEDHLSSLINKNEVGDHIKFYIPNWGMNGGGNVVAIPANAQHKAAALVFIDWLTSAKTQTALNATFGSAPTNTNADDSKALVPAEQRANTRDWVRPLSDKDVIPGFIANVVQN